MEDSFHLPNYLADDFLKERLSEKDQSAVILHLEECQDCRRLILFSISGAEHLLGRPSYTRSPEIDEKLRLYREWMQGSGAKIAGGRNVLWP